MIIYVILLMLSVTLLFFSRKLIEKNKYASSLLYIISIFLFTLVAGLRWNVGTDFLMYDSFFEIFKNRLSFSLQLEPAFIIICFITGKFCNSSFLAFFTIGLFIYYFVFKACKKSCTYYDVAIFLFICFGFFFSSLNVIRQWMAISVLLNVYADLDKKISFKQIAQIVLAIMCHYTAIFVIPFIFLAKKISKEKTRVILIILFILFYCFSSKILPILFGVLSNISMFAKYEKYATTKNYLNASFIFPAICLMIYFLYILFSKKGCQKDVLLEKMINLIIFAFGFSLIGTNIDIIERISQYFLSSLIIVLPIIYDCIKIPFNKKFVATCIIILGVAFFVNTMNNNGGEILPYQTRGGLYFK